MVLFILFFTCVLAHLVFWWWFYLYLEKNWRKGRFTLPKSALKKQVPVSVIISAKNEAVNLQKHLSKILNQQYSNFEVLVVNDYSTDATLRVLNTFQKKHPHLKIIESNDFKDVPGKKLALTKAIEMAQHNILLFTDADCYPNSPFWIQEMAARFTEGIDFVLGYGPYIKTEGLFNKFVQFETTLTALNYFSFALRGLPYMGVGRNLAYRKTLFYKADGFTKHLHIASGDDDLLISEMANATNVAICVAKNSWCYSAAKKSCGAYIRQKNRHVSTATSYKKNIQLILGLYALSHILLVMLLICSVFFKLFLIASVCTFILRTFSQYYFYHYLFNRLGMRNLRVFIPLLDVMLLGYYFLNLPGVITFKNNRWQ